MARGLLPLLPVVVLIMEAHCKNSTEAPIHIAHNKFITKKRVIAKRQVTCTTEEYNLNDQCCKKCERGHVKRIDCPTNAATDCVQCKPGQEFIDHINDRDKCMRCGSCDRELGFEVAKNCTPTQNTECTCAKDHFCNSSLPCIHCERCTICENGLVEKECTSTSDTVCRMKETGMPSWGIALLTLFVLAVAAAAAVLFYYKRKQKNFTSQENPSIAVTGREHSNETSPLIYTDVDLSSHVPVIVEQMTFPQVRTFVRKHNISEPDIDRIIRDNLNDTNEQKIKLFEYWHQKHGLKGAYGTLMSSLRDLEMYAIADKIEKKIRAAVSSHQEGGQSCSDNTEQSEICSQEGGKSCDSAELSKTHSDILEET